MVRGTTADGRHSKHYSIYATTSRQTVLFTTFLYNNRSEHQQRDNKSAVTHGRFLAQLLHFSKIFILHYPGIFVPRTVCEKDWMFIWELQCKAGFVFGGHDLKLNPHSNYQWRSSELHRNPLRSEKHADWQTDRNFIDRWNKARALACSGKH